MAKKYKIIKIPSNWRDDSEFKVGDILIQNEFSKSYGLDKNKSSSASPRFVERFPEYFEKISGFEIENEPDPEHWGSKIYYKKQI
jgi:hypothetical protein